MSERPSLDPEREPGLLATAIRRPVTVVSSVMMAVFFGVLALMTLPIQLTPDISLPTITVTTRWPGASPLEVETEILEEQEEVLKRVTGLDRMESNALSNQGEITLEFQVGTDIDDALLRVNNQLSQVPSYPESVDEPVVSTANTGGPPLAVLIVRHQDPGHEVGQYRTWIEEEIVPQIERIDGIASVVAFGGRETEVHVTFDTRALAAQKLTVPEVAARLRTQLRNASAGDVRVGKRRIIVRTQVTAAEAPEFGDLVLKVGSDGAPVHLRDVAHVSRGLRKAENLAISDDRDAIAMLPQREAGSNVLEVTEELRQAVAELQESSFAPEGLKLEIVSDQTGYINGALDKVRVNLLIGAVLATIVLFAFLRSLVAAAIVALAIPVCAVGTALAMAVLGRTVNVVSLAGVTFAVGMVVDNSIVALENIDTWRRRVSDAREAALRGIREVWGAILASTATTVVVFLPIISWEGEVGELLRDVAYAIATAVTLSLGVSLLVIPSLAARYLKSEVGEPGDSSSPESEGIAPSTPRKRPGLGERFAARYRRLIQWAGSVSDRVRSFVVGVAGHPVRATAIVAASVIGAILIAIALLPKMEYLPTGNRNLIFGLVLPPPGYSIEELRATGFQNQQVMMSHTGRVVEGVPAVERSFFAGDPSILFIGAVAEDPTQVRKLRDYMQALHSRIPGSIGFAQQAALFARGIGEGRAIDLEIRGNDLGQMVGLGRVLFGQLSQAIPGASIRPIPVLDEGAPEFHLVPRRSEAERLGYTPGDVALIADAYIDGAILGEYGVEGQRKVDFVLRSNDENFLLDPSRIAGSPVATPGGEVVPFGALADVRTRLGPTAIQRIERSRAVTLQLTPPDVLPLESAMEKVRATIVRAEESGLVPSGVSLQLGGSAGQLSIAQRQFGEILLVALVISYLLLAGLFENFLAPIVVLVTIPLAAAGGVVALWLVNALGVEQPLDLMTALGFLILIGVVVNNAILIVDGAIARLREGSSLTDAAAEAVRARVRPILMTTLTSLAGLLPMVLSTGDGSELYRGVGTIVLGGLTLATALSLFVVPSLFVLLWRLRSAVSPIRSA